MRPHSKALAVAALTLALVGCSTSPDADTKAEPNSPTSPTEVVEAGPAEVCTAIEEGLPDVEFVLPNSRAEVEAFETYAEDLRTLRDRAAARVVPILDTLVAAVETAAARDQDDITGNLDAEEEMDRAVADARYFCKSAGTPIFR